MLNYLKNIFHKNYKPFIKYAVVGVLGTAIDIGSLFVLVDLFYFPIIPAATISFLLATINNFILNKIWTFRHPSMNYRKLYIKFLIVSLVGLTLTLLSMNFFVFVLGIWYILAKALTSVIVLVWNFLANKFWTFKIASSNGSFDSSLDLSIIIPAYNEEKRIASTLNIINDYISSEKLNAEIIVIDDGSSDRTDLVVASFLPTINNLRFEKLAKNSGKGAAVRRGVELALGNLILFVDADNSTPIEQFSKLKQEMIENKADIAIGSRYLKSSNVKIKQPFFRIVLGRIGNFLIRAFLLDGVKDTQCGFKLFKGAAAKDIFSFQKVKRFGFDMELLVVAKNLGYTVSEVAVDWFDVGGSRLRPIKDAIITFKDLFYVKLNLWSGRYNRD